MNSRLGKKKEKKKMGVDENNYEEKKMGFG